MRARGWQGAKSDKRVRSARTGQVLTGYMGPAGGEEGGDAGGDAGGDEGGRGGVIGGGGAVSATVSLGTLKASTHQGSG